MRVVILGENVLRQKALPVENIDDDFRLLINEMFITMQKENGIGLAGPQINDSRRFFTILLDDGVHRVFVNPQIMGTSEKICVYEEGCLSIPGEYQDITRPEKVKVQAFDEKGKSFVLDADGILARAIQHEYDHLNGVLYIDRADEEFREKVIEKFKRRAQRRSEKEAAKSAKAKKIAAKKAERIKVD
ncbi:MAG TPA: peptide deformylase [Treponemataceae bacterium]|nr:peptide deformylase [Treponemataceae bacterium]